MHENPYLSDSEYLQLISNVVSLHTCIMMLMKFHPYLHVYLLNHFYLNTGPNLSKSMIKDS